MFCLYEWSYGIGMQVRYNLREMSRTEIFPHGLKKMNDSRMETLLYKDQIYSRFKFENFTFTKPTA